MRRCLLKACFEKDTGIHKGMTCALCTSLAM